MVRSDDYRKYLESEFKGIKTLMHAQFINVHERLEAIEKQTTKTNDRVSDLEDDIKVIERDLGEYYFFRKYPKLFISIISILVIVAIFTFYGLTININNKVKNSETTIKEEIRNMEGVSKVTRGGYVRYNNGGLSDSIKIK